MTQAGDFILTDDRSRPVISGSPYISQMQRRHFVLFDVVPNLMLIAAIPFHYFVPVRASDIIAFAVLWILTGLGVSVGYHRLFTHRAFKCGDGLRAVLAFLGSLAGQGPVVSWVSIHRRHHELSDRPGDPHSPNLHGEGRAARLRGLLSAHYTWMYRHDYPNSARYAADLLKDRAVLRVNRHYHAIALAGIVAPGVVCGLLTGSWLAGVSGMLWGGFIRMAVLGHTIWGINSFLHRFGGQPHQTGDNSRNAGLLGLLTFGESWHNNHHAFPNSPLFGLGRRWSDPGWWLVAGLHRLGLARELRMPAGGGRPRPAR